MASSSFIDLFGVFYFRRRGLGMTLKSHSILDFKNKMSQPLIASRKWNGNRSHFEAAIMYWAHNKD